VGHASVASFATFAMEITLHGAPADLLRFPPRARIQAA
jgi:hypothetical protein